MDVFALSVHFKNCNKVVYSKKLTKDEVGQFVTWLNMEDELGALYYDMIQSDGSKVYLNRSNIIFVEEINYNEERGN